ncbi:hypothetical protein IVB44_29625 [Bradyrhizobium sp. 49]|nr:MULTISPECIES: hypothetical protein [unclassified Bradyrhizobium]MCK1269341.1 hypothetical protein [Bradyrhizobium sp. 84]MCK1375048.1 hypothetical protein [Bradyrhizobium sp. 49]MCK1417923.1 hypothetical protein [Bradyrhizobium sp. CW4]
MDVSELLVQKYNLRAERTAATDEVEFTLTEREFDYRIRREFAQREGSVQQQVDKSFANHMAEVESRITSAKADFDRKLAEVEATVDRRFATLKANETNMLEGIGAALAEGVSGVLKQLRKEFQEQLGQLRADVPVARAHANMEEKEAEVVELMRRSQRGA